MYHSCVTLFTPIISRFVRARSLCVELWRLRGCVAAVCLCCPNGTGIYLLDTFQDQNSQSAFF